MIDTADLLMAQHAFDTDVEREARADDERLRVMEWEQWVDTANCVEVGNG